MRKCLGLILIALLLISSCQEEEAQFLSNKIELKEITVQDNKIKLEWNKPYIKNFNRYLIFKSDDPITDYSQYYSFAEINDIDQTIYYDNLSLEKETYYAIAAISSTSEPLISNSKKFVREDLIIFKNNPNDIVFYSEQNNLFVFIENKIFVVDYENFEISDSIVLNSDENYGSIGNYNGEDELYVACSDGNVFIYDMMSLNEKANFYVGGKVRSVVADNNNNIYVKTYDSSGKMTSYNRETLSPISTYIGFSTTGKLLHFSNTSRIVERTENNYYIYYYDHDLSGNLTNVGYIYNYNISYYEDISEITNETDYFIVGTTGVVFDSDLNFVDEIGDQYGNSFSSFFSEDYFYASVFENKEVQVFSNTNLNYIKEYSTNLYPLKVFKDNNTLIIFGTDEYYYDYYYSTTNFSIEKINLN